MSGQPPGGQPPGGEGVGGQPGGGQDVGGQDAGGQPGGGQQPVVVRPVRLTRVCRAAAVLLVVVFTAVALSLRRGSGADVFGVADQVAMALLGVMVATAVLCFTRARVVADVRSVRVRNVLGERDLPWQVVREVRLDPGASWASLELHDDDRVALLALQANDGEKAVRAVLALRSLLAASRRG